MKKILLNAYVDLNLGDDLFLKILFERYPNVKWILPKGGQIYKEIFRNFENVMIRDDIIFKIKRKLNIIEKNSFLNNYDAGVYIGGSIFMQLSEWKNQLKERKNTVYSFKKENKPYFILGSNFGPYVNEEFEKEYKKLFLNCKDVCFRDAYSYEIFRENNNVRLAPDIVFQLKPKNIKKIHNSIGISLINLNGRKDLEIFKNLHDKKFKQIIEHFIEQQKNITFFSFCKNQGDLEAINDIIKLLDVKYKDSIKIINYDGDIDRFLEEFEKMENIVGERFHACILSQVFNQGLYPILYSNKTYNVLKDIGLDQEYTFVKDLDSLDVNYVLEKISNNKISNRNIFKEAEKQFEVLDKYVRS